MCFHIYIYMYTYIHIYPSYDEPRDILLFMCARAFMYIYIYIYTYISLIRRTMWHSVIRLTFHFNETIFKDVFSVSRNFRFVKIIRGLQNNKRPPLLSFGCHSLSDRCSCVSNRAFRLIVQCSFIFASSNCDWLKWITWFILANHSCLWTSNYISSRASLPYLSCYHRPTTTILALQILRYSTMWISWFYLIPTILLS